jgi:FMN phosphatase YigB (HAD superfamily)/sugar phosphate isomerase/epimerase
MTNQIEAILFDMGGTLRSSIYKDEAAKLEVVRRIIDLLGADASPKEFAELLTERTKAYRYWAKETLIDVEERELWTKWLLPEWPAEQIVDLAMQLNGLWREATGDRVVFPESKEVVLELFRRGYRLGLVSNTISSVEIPHALQELELTGCFETVILSCVVGMRKPDPAILLEATRRMEIDPGKCVYIGNLLHRDVQSSREAGFSKVVIRRDPETFTTHKAKYPELDADHYIDNLKELLDIFPARKDKGNLPPAFDASLSTMWAKKNFTQLSDFFEAARRLGFARIELNHQIDSAMLTGIDLSRYQFSSVHEPCPADVSTDELKKRDWLISSPDEDKRIRGVEAIKRSIDLAHQLHAPVVVVHCGMVSTDLRIEKEMRELFDAGKAETDEYQELKQKLIERRADLIGPCFEAVKKSLLELLDYAGSLRIRLGLENRYHYFDIPSLDEMGELLSLAGTEQMGFIYDAGHAQALDRLGFYPHEEWLRRYASRMIGSHLHDVQGVTDHFAPGLGEVDYKMVASYLPADAYRTFELQVTNSPEQVKAGLKHLVEFGCVKPI